MKKIFAIFCLISLISTQELCYAVNRSDIQIEKNIRILKSELKKTYNAYEYVVTNNTKEKLQITNAQIINGVDGNIGFSTTEVGAGKSVGVLWAICGPVGIFTLGIGWIVGIIGTPIAYSIGHHKNTKTRKESLIYTNSFPSGFIDSNETINVLTLVPLGAESKLRITYCSEKMEDCNVLTY